MRRLWLVALAALPLLADNIRLYLKDGEYHLVREYQVQEDRVRYYSVERGDWEEIPTELVDLDKTNAEIGDRKKARAEEAKLLSEEDKAERRRMEEIARVPTEPGVYIVTGKIVDPLKLAETKVRTSKGRSVLKVLTPLPVVTGKGFVELDGEASSRRLSADRPEFYVRQASDRYLSIFKLTPGKGVRLVEKLTIVPVSNEVVEEPQIIEIFRQQVDDGLFKIWPQKPLAPGEYAVAEYTPGDVPSMAIYDFSIGAPTAAQKDRGK